MARPKTFDEDRAVDSAMRAFWAAGYEATSTQDLCDATGLGRSSVYNTFTSKSDLFEKSLLRYMEFKNAKTFEVLESDLPVREKMRILFDRAIDPDADEPVGCLVVKSTMELAPHVPAVAALIRRDFDLRLNALRAAFEAGRRAGEIGADRDPLALAHFMIATLSGMCVANCGGAGRAEVAAVANTALTAI